MGARYLAGVTSDETLRDDLGAEVTLPGVAARVVSLVPSLTEAIAATAPGTLVGATDWCTHPADLDVTRVRGTKNPDRDVIAQLAPDLVVANQEENRRLDVERLRAAGLAVWVTRIDTVPEAVASMSRLFREAFGLPADPGWLLQARAEWGVPADGAISSGAPDAVVTLPKRTAPQAPNLTSAAATAPTSTTTPAHSASPAAGPRVAAPIWRDPWMWVGAGTYTHDVLTRLGCVNVVEQPRYPTLSPADVAALRPDVYLLPDEPYAFTEQHAADLPGHTRLVPGRPLMWYGPAMVGVRGQLEL